jgi:hypothetical protein
VAAREHLVPAWQPAMLQHVPVIVVHSLHA